MNYFFDTYALVEVVKGNPNYNRFSENSFVTTTLNASEFYYFLLSNLTENKVNEIFNKFNFSYIEIDEESAIEGAKFRKKNYKRDLSYADCLGYILAKKKGLNFLTGDEFFKDVENVEFVR